MGGERLTSGPGPAADSSLSDVDLAELAAGFGLRLRQAGLPVTPEMDGRFAQAISVARPSTTAELYLVGQATLTCRHDQAELFRQVFQQVFEGVRDSAELRGDPNTSRPSAPVGHAESRPAGGAPERGRPELRPSPGPEPEAEEQLVGMLGAEERLASKDFSECTEGELVQILELIRCLPISLPRRRSLRLRSSRMGEALDVRATLRRAPRTGADPVQLVTRRHLLKPRRLVMIGDISASMEPYTRVYLNLFHSAVRATGAECFVFATRLTRLTGELGGSDPDLALRRAGARAPDWSGGTLIGQAVAEFNDRFGCRGMARGAVVVIVSDGWEGGDSVQLGRQMRRLRLIANRVVWVNPRSARASFVPATQGMVAALPHVDTLVSGHSLAAVQALLAAICGDTSPGFQRRRLTPAPS